MEFPTLGKNCFEKSCKQLDFLPMKCDACSRIFCKDHVQYSNHQCDAAYKKDIQVPVCPLCNKPIPVKRGELPDFGVSRHIDSDCQSDPAKEKRRVFSNKCSQKGCKQKELVPVLCTSCHRNFCLRHRHTVDHDCNGFQQSGQAVPRYAHRKEQLGDKQQMARKNQHKPLYNSTARLQAGLSEDEAMSRAIQMSLTEQQTNVDQSAARQQDQEAVDLALARALQESEQEEQRRQRQTEHTQQQQKASESKCHVS